jgi:hypothetical protein
MLISEEENCSEPVITPWSVISITSPLVSDIFQGSDDPPRIDLIISVLIFEIHVHEFSLAAEQLS